MATFNVGFVIFPDLTQLDFTGPLQVLHRLPQARTHIAAKTLDPVSSDCGLSLLPTTTFADCCQLDLICVPGGFGAVQALADPETLEFVRKQAAGASYVTSVCTGAFVLGAAELLQGRRATTHWAYTDLLSLVGAKFEKARFVEDGKMITGGGVTAGIDFAFYVAAQIAGADVAQAIQLSLEYDPAPPFRSGHPDRAPDEIKQLANPRYAKSRDAYRLALTA
jgi:cyclohexyl-isocyanide hydratase